MSRDRYAKTLYDKALFLEESDCLDSAVELYGEALLHTSDSADIYLRLGQVLMKQKKTLEAIACFEDALISNPGKTELLSDLGYAYYAAQKPAEASKRFEQLIKISPEPESAAIHNMLGLCYMYLKNSGLAEEHFNVALNIDPRMASAHNNIGLLSLNLGNICSAIESFQTSLSIKNDFAEVHSNLARAYQMKGKIEEAVVQFRLALTYDPKHIGIAQNLVFAMNYLCGADPLLVLREHQDVSEMFPGSIEYPPPLPHDKIRIGYVSPDFKQHPVAFFISPVLRCHDTEKFEIFCYANVPLPDNVTEQLRAFGHTWRWISGQTDAMVAEQIHKDGIDILVDLAGHTVGNLLGVFALRPAPLQVSWLGYPNTTGLAEIGYRITDKVADPPGLTDCWHSELLIRLDDCFLCYAGPRDIDLPERVVQEEAVSFCCFNNMSKINQPLLAVWARILTAVPGSRLLLKNLSLADESLRLSLRDSFIDMGISADRLELCGVKASFEEHLAWYNKADIALDSFPYNGTTTTCEALWMGVPVVTWAGQIHASRVGASILSTIGLSGLIAVSEEEYVNLAVTLARDRASREQLRRTTRVRMMDSPLMDAPAFTKRLENAFYEMLADQ